MRWWQFIPAVNLSVALSTCNSAEFAHVRGATEIAFAADDGVRAKRTRASTHVRSQHHLAVLFRPLMLRIHSAGVEFPFESVAF